MFGMKSVQDLSIYYIQFITLYHLLNSNLYLLQNHLLFSCAFSFLLPIFIICLCISTVSFFHTISHPALLLLYRQSPFFVFKSSFLFYFVGVCVCRPRILYEYVLYFLCVLYTINAFLSVRSLFSMSVLCRFI